MRGNVKVAFCLVLGIALLLLPGDAQATPIDSTTRPTGPQPAAVSPSQTQHVRVLDENRTPEIVDQLNTSADSANRTFSLTVKDSDSRELTVLVNSSWIDALLLEPALVDAKYEMETYEGVTWYGVRIPQPGAGRTLVFEAFKPKIDRAAFSRGSLQSVRLERPMFMSIKEVPHLETETVRMSTGNGTWVGEVPKPVNRLGIELTDSDTTGQTVTLNRSWLGAYVLTAPFFQYADGTSISNASDAYNYRLYPPHFSILYVFTTDESFTKESDQPNSNVYRDSVNRNIYVLSDRSDPAGTNERLRSPAPVTYDQTSSFKLRATWKTSQQGNWQNAVPVFLMGAGNGRVDMANSVYVRYYSRDSNLGYSPYYYLRYHDGAGNLRMDYLIVATANVQYEFLASYDSYTRVLSFTMYDSFGVPLGSPSYTLGAGETFTLGKVGAAAWGASNYAEPPIVATTDNIFLEANMARNGNFEIDSNSDGIPDNWQVWIWTSSGGARSQDRAKYGLWSHKIVDSSASQAYGLQTARMSVGPGETYAGSTWVYVSSGSNQLCLEFWNSASGGTRLGVVCKSTVTSLAWEFLDVTMQVPSGASYADLLVNSSLVNVGTGYFDGAELKRSRSSWSVHVHTNHVPDAATWRTVLDYVTDLGITYVRIDFTWAGFEPSRDGIDWNHVAYWDAAVRVIRSRGVGIVAILSGPIPGWASTLFNGCPGIPPPCPPDKEAFFAEWREFAAFIASRYGQDVQYYQLLNEENHFSHSLFDHEHQYGEPRAFYEAYLGLEEGTGLVSFTHKSRFKTIVNAFADPGGDEFNAWFRDILNDPWGPISIDVVAIDHYPGTWCCGSNYRDWAALDTLLAIARDFGKELGVLETGFTSYGPNPLGNPQHFQTDQEAFVDQAMDQVLVKRNSFASTDPLNAFLLLSYYEFIDLCSDCGGWPLTENHFGILTYAGGAWGVKLAYDNLRYQVSRWG